MHALVDFLAGEIDFIHLLAGFSFLIAAVTCLQMRSPGRYHFRWEFLGYTSLIMTTHHWYNLVRIRWQAGYSFDIPCSFLWAASLITLLEFTRRNAPLSYLRNFSRWLYIPLMAVTFCGLAYENKPIQLATVIFILGWGGSGVILLLWNARIIDKKISFGIKTVAVTITLYCSMKLVLFGQYAGLWKGYALIQFCLTIFALLYALSVYALKSAFDYNTVLTQDKRILPRYNWIIAGTIIAVVCTGWIATHLVGITKDREKRSDLLKQTEIAASFIDAKQFAEFSATADDLQNPEYQHQRELLLNVGKQNNFVRWFYTMKKKNDKIIFVSDSVPADSADHEDSGAPYALPPLELFTVFSSGEVATVGPYTDEYGTFISAFTPMLAPGTKKIIGVFGIDIDASAWKQTIFNARLWPIIVTLFTLLSLLLINAYLHKQIESSQTTLVRLNYREALLHFAKITLFDLTEGFRLICQEISATMRVERTSIWLYNSDSTQLLCSCLFTSSSAQFESGHKLDANKYPGYFNALTEKRVIDADNARTDPSTKEFSLDYLEPLGIFSMLDVPIWSHGKVIGVLCCEHSALRHWKDEEKDFLISASESISSFISHSERLAAEKELFGAYEKLKTTQLQLVQSSKMAAIGQLASGVAHEINNPLTGVLNNAQLIKMELSRNQNYNLNDFRELLDIIENSAARCQKITQSLLEFSRAPQKQFQKISLSEVAQKACTVIRQELVLRNIAITTKFLSPIPPIQGNPQLLQQVIFDLMVNAQWAIEKKSGQTGGTITIATTHNPQAKTVSVSVKDSGIGIPQENLSRIFEPFFTTKDVGQGTGIGLALAYNIIEAHNGEIKAESQVDEGSIFTLTFPEQE